MCCQAKEVSPELVPPLLVSSKSHSGRDGRSRKKSLPPPPPWLSVAPCLSSIVELGKDSEGGPYLGTGPSQVCLASVRWRAVSWAFKPCPGPI